MTTPTEERRRGSRVFLMGNMHWHCDEDIGEGRIIDISPRGASFETPEEQAPAIGQVLRLHMDLDEEVEWRVSDGAKVVRKELSDPDACQVAVAFIKAHR